MRLRCATKTSRLWHSPRSEPTRLCFRENIRRGERTKISVAKITPPLTNTRTISNIMVARHQEHNSIWACHGPSSQFNFWVRFISARAFSWQDQPNYHPLTLAKYAALDPGAERFLNACSLLIATWAMLTCATAFQTHSRKLTDLSSNLARWRIQGSLSDSSPVHRLYDPNAQWEVKILWNFPLPDDICCKGDNLIKFSSELVENSRLGPSTSCCCDEIDSVIAR
jgi:hypothetical protein